MSARQRSVVLRVRLLGAALCLAAAGPASADWRRDYDLGRRALEQGDYAAAERYMRAAVAEEAESNAKKRFQGQRYDLYAPRWYAGVAAFRQGDCARAMEYWRDPQTAAILREVAELGSEYRRLAGECETRLAAQRSPPPQVAAATPPQEPARAEPKPAPPTAGREPAATPPAPSVARAEPPEATRQTPSRPETMAPPRALREALDAYLAGRYQTVVAVDPNAFDGRARSFALLLRAASRHALAERNGSEAELAQVRADIRAARAAQARLALDEGLFSPRFRTLASSTR